MYNILICDDQPDIVNALKIYLTPEGYNLLTASSGAEALEIAKQADLHLILLDVMMPQMDGYEFTRTLRKGNNDLPILMVSAKQLPKDKKAGFLAGPEDYMTKPIDEEEMLLRIRALLRRAGNASDRRITLGDVALDYDSFTVARGTERHELPQKEFLLL